MVPALYLVDLVLTMWVRTDHCPSFSFFLLLKLILCLNSYILLPRSDCITGRGAVVSTALYYVWLHEGGMWEARRPQGKPCVCGPRTDHIRRDLLLRSSPATLTLYMERAVPVTDCNQVRTLERRTYPQVLEGRIHKIQHCEVVQSS
jgi:hypothetical protein